MAWGRGGEAKQPKGTRETKSIAAENKRKHGAAAPAASASSAGDQPPDKKLKALRQVQEDQVEVQLTDQAARAIRLADDFRHLAPALDTLTAVTIAPPASVASYTARLVIDDGQRQPLSFDNLAIDLVRLQPGKGRFTNRRQPSPVLLRFDMHLDDTAIDDTPLANGTLHYEPASRNVSDLHAHHRLAARLRRRCTLRLIDRTKHERIIERRSTAAKTAAGDPAAIKFLENLVRLQDYAGVTLNISEGLSEADLAALDRLSTIVSTGSLRGRWERLEVTVTITNPVDCEAMLSGESRRLRLVGNGVEHYAGDAFPLGPAEITYRSAVLTDPASIRDQLARSLENVRLCFTPGDVDTLERRYLEWIPRRRAARPSPRAVRS